MGSLVGARARLHCAVLFEVTDHAADRYRQRIRGTMQAKAEITTRVSHAYDAGRVETGPRGETLVRDRQLPGLIFVCKPTDGRLLVITLWEDDDAAARVPKRYTDALRRTDHMVE
jgi:hypothetical protein